MKKRERKQMDQIEFENLKTAADSGDADAQCALGLECLFSRGLPNLDYEEATKYLKLSADQGNRDAQYHLAGVYYNGYGFGYVRQLKDAAKWNLAAAKQGHQNAMHDMSLIYELGSGVPIDLDEGKRWRVLYEASLKDDCNTQAA